MSKDELIEECTRLMAEIDARMDELYRERNLPKPDFGLPMILGDGKGSNAVKIIWP